MEKVCVTVIAILTFGTVLSIIGRFAPGLFQADGVKSVSGGKVVNASFSWTYYYTQFCDEGTSDCYVRTIHERYEDLKVIYGITTKDWLIERVGELTIDAIALISNILGYVLAVATYTKTSRHQALQIVAAPLLLISATLQLTNLGSLFAEIKAYHSSPAESYTLLFPYAIPLTVIGSVCLLVTSLVLYFSVILLLFQREKEGFQSGDGNLTNLENVTPVPYTTVSAESTHNQDPTSGLTNTEKTSL